MLFIILFLLMGISLGLLMKKIAILTKTNERVLTILYYPLFFLIAILLKLDDKIVSNLNQIGWNSFFYLIGFFAIGILVTWSVYKLLILFK